MNQFIASAVAVAEKMAPVMTLDYLEAEVPKGRRGDFDHFLGLVPDTAPMPADELPKP